MYKVIIVGATSGIGRGLAELFAAKGCIVGITGRRENLLREIQSKFNGKCIAKVADVTDTVATIKALNSLYEELNGMDLLIISAGTGEINTELDFSLEQPTILTNVLGFTAVADWGYKIFEQQRSGHLVVITSIAGIKGSSGAPAYNASKAYQINYLQGLRQKAEHQRLPVCITDIRPGFVDTDMAKGEGLFWVASVDKAVRQIYRGIQRKRKVMYVSRRWRLAAWVLKAMP